jgi:hypothetical protein
MSKVAITGNASGTGVFTVASPNSNVDRVLTLPDETGTVDTLQRSGNVIQVVNFQTGVFASGTTTIPQDNTIPQVNEGDQYMSLAITPTSASNKLFVEVTLNWRISGAAGFAITLFRDGGANALAVGSEYDSTTGARMATFSHVVVAGSVSATTFTVRAGMNNAGTTTINGSNVALWAGTAASTITITEMTP